MIRTAIIDDEIPARERVRFFLQEMEHVEIVGEASNGEEGVLLLEKERPQLVFLDIQMPVLSGFGLLEKCTFRPAVIFISAYDEYAIQAFEVNAVDYLLKPYSKERFHSAMKRVLNSIKDTEHWDRKIAMLLESYSRKDHYLQQVTAKKGHIYKVFPLDEIDFFKMDGGLLFLHSEGEKLLMDTPLNQLELHTPPSSFFRVHRNALVNLKRIAEVIPWGNGRLVLDFGTSGRVQVSREKVKMLKMHIGLKM